MIRQPKVGQRVQLWYRDHSAALHGLTGTVDRVGNGPGPRNVAVLLDERMRGRQAEVVVTRGNLRPPPKEEG